VKPSLEEPATSAGASEQLLDLVISFTSAGRRAAISSEVQYSPTLLFRHDAIPWVVLLYQLFVGDSTGRMELRLSVFHRAVDHRCDSDRRSRKEDPEGTTAPSKLIR
jgi:hypothetical protein